MNTPAIWLFALLPILTTAAIAVAYFVLGYFPDIPWWAALGGPISLYLLLARSDQKKLETIGHSRLTSPFWALLPLVFLIIRTVRLGKRALAPLLVSILGGVVMAAATVLVVLPMLALAAVGSLAQSPEQRAIDLTPAGAAAVVTADLAFDDVVVTDTVCAAFPTLDVGAQTTCTFTAEGAPGQVAIEILPVESPFAFSYVE